MQNTLRWMGGNTYATKSHGAARVEQGHTMVASLTLTNFFLKDNHTVIYFHSIPL
jgi:hypothetical protein